MVKNFKCVVSYKGSNYSGWQKQKQKQIMTVQGMLEFALQKFFGGEIKTTGASRTDAGVHAFGQVFSFMVETKLEGKGIKSVLNGILPPDIRIRSCDEASFDFSPRRDVKTKLYRYVIYNRQFMSPVFSDLAWHVHDSLDMAGMRTLLPLFKGRKNYFSFSAASDKEDHFREVKSIAIKKRGPWITLDFKGRGFLYNMIRRITAAMVEHAKGNLSFKDIEDLFKSEDRSKLTFTAPPHGLYLVKIIYERKAG
jgi:tRNA pseudouridine38-40 synthase